MTTLPVLENTVVFPKAVHIKYTPLLLPDGFQDSSLHFIHALLKIMVPD